MNTISFTVTHYDPDEPSGAPCIEPVVDGAPLSSIVGGDHAGIVWYGSPTPAELEDSYFGRSVDDVTGRISLLGCSCGEFGCDPFSMELHVGDRTVAWRHSSAGPFLFPRDAYERAVAQLVRDVADFSA